jgi:flagella basal body P-ring formation protein FlgA
MLPSPCPARVRPTRHGRWLATVLLASAMGALAGHVRAQPSTGTALPDDLAAQVQRLAREAAVTVWGNQAKPPRIEVVIGRVDAQMKLAPCQQVAPYLPAGMRPLGHTRIGLRCLQGPTRWNVTVPVDIRLWARSLVAATVLPVGTRLETQHLVEAEVDIADRNDPAIMQPAAAVGRILARNLAAGAALRQGDLRVRQYFVAGDTVRIVAVGAGYAISSEGQALGPGLEGQTAKVRTEGGRVITGIATGERRLEVAL